MESSKESKLSIIIPVFNEEECVDSLLAELKGTLTKYKILYEIVIVNDDSTDSTLLKVKKHVDQDSKIFLINNPERRGLGRCLRFGFENSIGDIIVVVMGDHADNINDIPAMLNKIIHDGFDFVCASRYMKDGEAQQNNFLKGRISKLLGRITNFILKVPTLDSTNAYKMFRRELLNNIGPLKSKYYTLGFELVIKSYFKGFKITEIPTIWKERISGNSHFKCLREGMEYLQWFLIFMLKYKNKK